jgi:hypothetical protein
MYASIRRYSGADPRLWDQLQQHRASLEAAFRRVPGFRSWYLVRTGSDGLTTVTLCDDQAGAEESVRTAANWIRENIPDLISGQPEVSTGEVPLQIGG